jgi:hypothetical protein
MNEAEIKLPFGVDRSNRVVHISDVERGRACDCTCPGCSAPLEAAKGSIRQHHFRHAVDVECEGAAESAIHRAAKQLIRERRQLTLPRYILSAQRKYHQGGSHHNTKVVVRGETTRTFDSVEEECELHGMRADLLAIEGDRPLMIEIRYRHAVDEDKRAKIRAANISAVEIDLSDAADEVSDWESLWLMINDPARILWLHNAKEELAFSERQETKQQRVQRAIADMTELSAPARIEEMGRRQAELHQIWQQIKTSLAFTWDELPTFLNVPVRDGNWIYGCDQRLWQIAFYSYFVCKRRTPFSVQTVDDWLQSTAGLNVPSCVNIINRYSLTSRELMPALRKGVLPGPRNTLDAYFRVLCEIGILAPGGPPWGPHSELDGDRWYSVRRAEPAAEVNQQSSSIRGSSLARPRLPTEGRGETPSQPLRPLSRTARRL